MNIQLRFIWKRLQDKALCHHSAAEKPGAANRIHQVLEDIKLGTAVTDLRGSMLKRLSGYRGFGGDCFDKLNASFGPPTAKANHGPRL